ncbi:MAG: L-seryl-tRNA(Sec) selenium transferase [Gemmataceae bacterium]
MTANPFRLLPPVNEVLRVPRIATLVEEQPRELITEAIREELNLVRQKLRNGWTESDLPDAETLAERVIARFEKAYQPNFRTVINATGIILHTNLGRAPMAEEAASAAYHASRAYLNLELDLESGKRSSRQLAVRNWLCKLTGAEAATAVNNNAAATVIALRAICQGKEVILSRGQLVEIGGSFRIPEIMAVSGAILHEVGTTNITRIGDYAKAINENTGALLRVHTSNYRIRGHTKAASLEELIALGNEHNVPVIDDAGSGAMVNLLPFGFSDEPRIQDSVQAGADLVLFSGDKLLGGPQAGILVGRAKWISMIEKDPLMRAFRLDKMTLAALEATLRIYLDERRIFEDIPYLRMVSTPVETLQERAQRLLPVLTKLPGVQSATIGEGVSFVGGGSLPDESLPSIVISITPSNISVGDFAYALRMGTPAVVARVRDGQLLIDLRTVFPDQDKDLTKALSEALTKCAGAEGKNDSNASHAVEDKPSPEDN